MNSQRTNTRPSLCDLDRLALGADSQETERGRISHHTDGTETVETLRKNADTLQHSRI